jgi:hypothetical protein
MVMTLMFKNQTLMKKIKLLTCVFLGTITLAVNAQITLPPPTVGSPIQLNPSTDGYDIEDEVHISIDRNNPNNLVVCTNALDNIGVGGSCSYTIPYQEACYNSTDGGNTWVPWQTYDYFPNVGPNSPTDGDPSTAIDANGVQYISTMNLAGCIHPYTDRYFLDVSTDHGATWTLEDPGPIFVNQFDKEMITADDNPGSPYINSVYCTYTQIGSFPIYFQKYTGGLSGSFLTPVQLFSQVGYEGTGANIQTGLGGQIYVCWAQYYTSREGAMGMGFCSDLTGGGTSFGSSVLAFHYTGYDGFNGAEDVNTDINGVRVNCFPSMAVDKSCGPHQGRIYVAYGCEDDVTPKPTHDVIELQYSDDNGATWFPNHARKPILLSPSSNLSISLFPWVTVDDVTGIVYVVYKTMSSVNYGSDVYMAYSTDGDNYTSIQVTHTGDPFTAAGNTSQGEYIGVAAHNGKAYVAYMDDPSYNGDYQAFVAPVNFPTIVNPTSPWNGTQVIPADIEITSGNTLVVNGTVQMLDGHSIFVDPGAKLVVNGTITHATCGGHMWAGISCEGVSLGSQYVAGMQGQVTLNPGSKIEYAINGITTGKLTSPGNWDLTTTGGIINAAGATFLNCQRAVQYLSFSNPSPHALQNKGLFTGCTFDVDVNYPTPPIVYPLQPAVSMWDVHGVSFLGNTFENNMPVSYSNFRGTAIHSVDASYSVTNCNVINIITGKCAGTPNTFTGYEFGILGTNSNPVNTVNIIGCDFTNNYADIDMQGVDYLSIDQNTFMKSSVPPILFCFGCRPYCTYLDQCTGYSFSNNSFTATAGVPNAYGAIFNNNGIQDNLVNNNSFSGLYVGSQGQGTNGAVFLTCYHPPCNPPYETFQGLQILCNQNTSTIAGGADISVTSGEIDPQQGTCASASTTANNTFNNDCPARLNIYVSNTAVWGIGYNYPNAAGYMPNCYSTPEVAINNCLSVSTPTCTTPLIITIGNLYALLHADIANNQTQLTSANNLLNGGDAARLYSIINIGSNGEIKNTLLAAGPYLSDGVLAAAINKGLSPGIIKDILLPNCPLDSYVLGILNSSSLPPGIKNQIVAAQTGVSARTEMVGQASYFQSAINNDINGLVRYYLNDTIGNGLDSAELLIQSIQPAPTCAQLAQVGFMQVANNEIAAAQNTLTAVQNMNDNTMDDYCKILPILIQLQQSSSHAMGLASDSTALATVNQIANDNTSGTLGSINALALLNFLYNTQYNEPIEPIQIDNSRVMSQDNNNYAPAAIAKVYPNPASSTLNVETDLAIGQVQNICLYNSLGQQVRCQELSESLTTLQVSDLSTGIYFYRITDQQGNLVKADKVILIH